MRYFLTALMGLMSLRGTAHEKFSSNGPFTVEKILAFQASAADSNTQAIFRVKTSDGFVRTLSCTLPQKASREIKRVKILELDKTFPGKTVYFCLGSAE